MCADMKPPPTVVTLAVRISQVCTFAFRSTRCATASRLAHALLLVRAAAPCRRRRRFLARRSTDAREDRSLARSFVVCRRRVSLSPPPPGCGRASAARVLVRSCALDGTGVLPTVARPLARARASCPMFREVLSCRDHIPMGFAAVGKGFTFCGVIAAIRDDCRTPSSVRDMPR